MPSAHRTLLLVSGLALFWMIESAVPLFSFKSSKWRHAGVNIFFTLTTAAVNFSMAFLLVFAADWVVANQFGLIQWTSLPLWLEAVIGVLLLDLIGAWLIHYIQHHVKWMWKFHLIHHTDQEVDTTTANRHHPGESVFRFVFTTLAVVAIGTPIWMVFVYQSLSVILSQFNHSNIKLPSWLDKAFVTVICTPNMHHVHHHYRMPYSDTNYGNIFSFWDRIFRTYEKVDNDKLVYGVDTHMEDHEHKSVSTMLGIPFQEYRGHIEYDELDKIDSIDS